MSERLYVITNSKGSNDRVLVYGSGDVWYEGHGQFRPQLLFELLYGINGLYEDVKYVELDDEQYENWQEHY
jgi:hypothetical protein